MGSIHTIIRLVHKPKNYSWEYICGVKAACSIGLKAGGSISKNLNNPSYIHIHTTEVIELLIDKCVVHKYVCI